MAATDDQNDLTTPEGTAATIAKAETHARECHERVATMNVIASGNGEREIAARAQNEQARIKRRQKRKDDQAERKKQRDENKAKLEQKHAEKKAKLKQESAERLRRRKASCRGDGGNADSDNGGGNLNADSDERGGGCWAPFAICTPSRAFGALRDAIIGLFAWLFGYATPPAQDRRDEMAAAVGTANATHDVPGPVVHQKAV